MYDNEEKKCFQPIRFPVEETFKYYQTWRGFQTEANYEASKDLYGNNV